MLLSAIPARRISLPERAHAWSAAKLTRGPRRSAWALEIYGSHLRKTAEQIADRKLGTKNKSKHPYFVRGHFEMRRSEMLLGANPMIEPPAGKTLSPVQQAP